MDGKDRVERAPDDSGICSLEWIAWAMEAARRHKEVEHFGAAPPDNKQLAEED